MQRSSLFRSDNDAIRRQIGSNPFVWQVMTPFDLDQLINPPEKKEAKVKDPNSIAELKKRQELMGDFYEEDENDFGCRLYDTDFD